MGEPPIWFSVLLILALLSPLFMVLMWRYYT